MRVVAGSASETGRAGRNDWIALDNRAAASVLSQFGKNVFQRATRVGDGMCDRP